MIPRYYVFTWDMDIQKYTPQVGVPCGPHSAYGLRQALHELRSMGYSAHRVRDTDGTYDNNDTYVLVCAESELDCQGNVVMN